MSTLEVGAGLVGDTRWTLSELSLKTIHLLYLVKISFTEFGAASRMQKCHFERHVPALPKKFSSLAVAIISRYALIILEGWSSRYHDTHNATLRCPRSILSWATYLSGGLRFHWTVTLRSLIVTVLVQSVCFNVKRIIHITLCLKKWKRNKIGKGFTYTPFPSACTPIILRCTPPEIVHLYLPKIG